MELPGKASSQLLNNLQLSVEEKNLTFDDLLSADEAFYSGTAVEITPITMVDGSKIGQWFNWVNH